MGKAYFIRDWNGKATVEGKKIITLDQGVRAILRESNWMVFLNEHRTGLLLGAGPLEHEAINNANYNINVHNVKEKLVPLATLNFYPADYAIGESNVSGT